MKIQQMKLKENRIKQHPLSEYYNSLKYMKEEIKQRKNENIAKLEMQFNDSIMRIKL